MTFVILSYNWMCGCVRADAWDSSLADDTVHRLPVDVRL
jgi:hypothetical protein